MTYAILNFDLLSVREYRNFDVVPSIKMVNGEPLARPVVWDADPVFDPATERLWEGDPIIEATQVRRRYVVQALDQADIDEIADTAAQDALFDTMRTYYSVFDAGTATVAQAQKAIAWLIKQEAKARGAEVS
jgi:hypothetical protein